MVYEEPTSLILGTPGRRFTVFEEPRFTVYGELKAGYLFLHCSPIKQWSRSTYMSCLEAMNIIKAAAKAHGYDTVWTFLPLARRKFMSMMGFEIVRVFDTDHGPFVLGVQGTGDN